MLFLHEKIADLVTGVYESDFACREESLLEGLAEKRFAVLPPPLGARTPRPVLSRNLHREKPLPVGFEKRFHEVDGTGKWARFVDLHVDHRSALFAEVAANPDVLPTKADMATFRLIHPASLLLAVGELQHQLVGGRTRDEHVILLHPQQNLAPD